MKKTIDVNDPLLIAKMHLGSDAKKFTDSELEMIEIMDEVSPPWNICNIEDDDVFVCAFLAYEARLQMNCDPFMVFRNACAYAKEFDIRDITEDDWYGKIATEDTIVDIQQKT